MSFLARRQQAFETMFVHEEAMRFRVRARRNKALAKWAAEMMKLSEVDANSYLETIIAVAVEAGMDEAVVKRVGTDLAMVGFAISYEQVRAQMDLFTTEAERSFS
ncbi:DUF1476 domain-containing protein [Lichenifustis flavocetrariae]|uniref:DUF1476 domain-containing protein n=1 Tax=Lichenifustis flavocetrariae TaxID=2949735 RepID=A0AA41YRI8_9HYPH|nr:DUF1476 domain-containing protein [Lichenifustis flavocetrariae]MCW6506849.1 DUF1476 domain-containing protein [Lichenifustis flavocetrariae]